MTGRRQFGTTRRLQSGRWQARFWVESEGRQISAPQTFATKTEACTWLSSVETDRARGRFLDPDAGKIPLRQYAVSWLATKVNLAPRTREIYQDQLERDILPELGRLQLVSVTPERVRRWYAHLARTRSPSVAAKAYVRLKQILTEAVEDERIARNRCRIRGGGIERHPEQRSATPQQLLVLANAVGDRYRALVLTAGMCGLRQGELFALRREDVDLTKATISVRRKRLRLASGEVIEGDPKSHAGRRVVAMPEVVVSALRRHMAEFTAADADAYVFTGPKGRPIDRTNFCNRMWLPAVRRAGMEGFRFHDLRVRHEAPCIRAG